MASIKIAAVVFGFNRIILQTYYFNPNKTVEVNTCFIFNAIVLQQNTYLGNYRVKENEKRYHTL
jgi:hypothetical protein